MKLWIGLQKVSIRNQVGKLDSFFTKTKGSQTSASLSRPKQKVSRCPPLGRLALPLAVGHPGIPGRPLRLRPRPDHPDGRVLGEPVLTEILERLVIVRAVDHATLDAKPHGTSPLKGAKDAGAAPIGPLLQHL